MIKGQRFYISGDSKEIGLEDYDVSVYTGGTILEAPDINDNEVYVSLDIVDGDANVSAYILKDKFDFSIFVHMSFLPI